MSWYGNDDSWKFPSSDYWGSDSSEYGSDWYGWGKNMGKPKGRARTMAAAARASRAQ